MDACATSASRTTRRRLYGEVEAVLRGEALDFLQINYLRCRSASRRKRLLPLAAERGVVVLVNRPFGGGGFAAAAACAGAPP
jgi:hypothetical protein